MYVLRPKKYLTTPRRLAEALGWRLRHDQSQRYHDTLRHLPDAFRFTYRNHPNSLADTALFYSMHKQAQREFLEEAGVTTPINAPTRYPSVFASSGDPVYVVRPHRHMGGDGWVLANESTSASAGFYCARVFPKRWEYRVVYVRGRRAYTLVKRLPPEGLHWTQPWNYTNGTRWVTVTDPANDRLRHTPVYQHLEAVSALMNADIIGVDVMLTRSPEGEWCYCVAEVNFCPAVTLPANLARIVELINAD